MLEIIPAWESSHNWRILKVLGQGWEGVVYLVADRDTNRRSVVKIFHSPKPVTWGQGLRTYARCVTGDEPGLLKIKLLNHEDQILGVSYNYRPLFDIHRLLRARLPQAAQALIGSYCRIQARLIGAHGLVLLDPYAWNFRLARDGQFYWADFGWGVAQVEDPWSRERGLIGYGFAMLLISLYNQDIKFAMQPSLGYSYTQPCRYCLHPRLDELTHKHNWLGTVLEEVRGQPAAAFLEPEFYRRLSARLPERVQAPNAIILASNLLSAAGRARAMWRQALGNGPLRPGSKR